MNNPCFISYKKSFIFSLKFPLIGFLHIYRLIPFSNKTTICHIHLMLSNIFYTLSAVFSSYYYIFHRFYHIFSHISSFFIFTNIFLGSIIL